MILTDAELIEILSTYEIGKIKKALTRELWYEYKQSVKNPEDSSLYHLMLQDSVYRKLEAIAIINNISISEAIEKVIMNTVDFKNPVHLKQKEKQNRFTDNGDGTVTDNITKLIWLKNANAFGLSTWEQALAFADTLSSGSHGLTDGSNWGDWRLPNKKELESLIDFAYTYPALSSASGTSQWASGDAFIGVQSNPYWSSTTYSDGSAGAWIVYLGDGAVGFDHKSNRHYVWPVRLSESKT